MHDKRETAVIDVAPDTIVVYSDIACPWAHVAVFRLWQARTRAGLTDVVRFEHRPFPLEVVNHRPTPKRVLDGELPVVGALEPDAGWQLWQDFPSAWPVTTLPALEAVQAAADQSSVAAERLDRALRCALFAESRCISMRHVILDVAARVDGVDVDRLRDALDTGRARARLWGYRDKLDTGVLKGSPHLFFPDGSDVHNPGIVLHWNGEHGRGFPIIERDDRAVYDELVRRAVSAVARP